MGKGWPLGVQNLSVILHCLISLFAVANGGGRVGRRGGREGERERERERERYYNHNMFFLNDLIFSTRVF